MKKLLLTLITAVTISSNLLSMNTDGINLKLDQKPKFVPTYEWCKKIAEEFVQEKKKDLLKVCGIKSEQELAERKRFLQRNNNKKSNHTNPKCSDNKCKRCIMLEDGKEISFPKEFNIKITNILKDLKEKSIIKEFSEVNGIIKAKIKDGTWIRFVNSSCAMIGIAMTDGSKIYISPKVYKDDGLSEKSLEGAIGHELGHILCKHLSKEKLIEKDLLFLEMQQKWEQYLKDLEKYSDKPGSNKTIEETIKNNENFLKSLNNYDKFSADFDCARYNFDKAIETQADLVGILGNADLAFAMRNLFDKYAKEIDSEDSIDTNCNTCCDCNCEMCLDEKNNPEHVEKCGCGGLPPLDEDCNDFEHPSDKARAEYFGQIYESMLKDCKLPAKPMKEIKIQAPVQNQQAIINPAIIKKEPVVIKPVIINKQAPVSTQKVNKVSEMAKKYEKIAQDKKINNLVENKII